jgi:hypothetical protein
MTTGRPGTALITALALGATLACENSFAPEVPALAGPWRGAIEVTENSCTGDTQDDVQTWLISQSGDVISIFFSHQNYVGTVERGGRFETERSAQSPDGTLQVAATITGAPRSEGRLVATEVVEQSGPASTCRIVRTYTMERFGS